MKLQFFLIFTVAIILWVCPCRDSAGQSVKAASPALRKVAEELQTMIADHPKRAAIGVVTAEIPDKLARLSNRARYLSGEIRKDEFLRRSDEITARWNAIFADQRQTGQYDADHFLSFAEGVIVDYSLP
jgi:hypothetical protein